MPDTRDKCNESPAKAPDHPLFYPGAPDITNMEKRPESRSQVYLAAPLFSDAERTYNLVLRDLLAADGYQVYLPQETGEGVEGAGRDGAIFESHISALDAAGCVVAVCDGADTDSGTAWEIGYAVAKGIPVIALSTDRRRPEAGRRVNLMIQESAEVVGTMEGVLTALRSIRS
jgi:nucleoside 2-deoxyribosyltransferase